MKKLNQTTNILLLVAIAFIVKSILDQQAILALVGCFLMVLVVFRRLLIKQAIQMDSNENRSSLDFVMRYLMQDKTLYIEMIVAYTRGNCDVLYEENDGILLYDHTSDIYLASAKSIAGAKDIVLKLPQDYGHFIAHDEVFLMIEEEMPAYSEKLSFYNYRYPHKGVYKLLEHNVTLRAVEISDKEIVKQQYRIKALCTDEYIIKRIEAGMLGAYLENELIGFVGKHENDAIGMLEVKEAYRNKHIGQLLVMAFVNQLLEKQEEYIYTQVESNNIASNKLQEKLLFERSNTLTYWYFSEKY